MHLFTAAMPFLPVYRGLLLLVAMHLLLVGMPLLLVASGFS